MILRVFTYKLCAIRYRSVKRITLNVVIKNRRGLPLHIWTRLYASVTLANRLTIDTKHQLLAIGW